MDRQEIIERAINIENVMGVLITHHFFPFGAVKADFMHTVLQDPHANTAFKISVFAKCYPDVGMKLLEKIRRVFSIRNIFAHCGLSVTLLADPENAFITDPKKWGEPLDFNALKEEFLAKEEDVLQALAQMIEQSGIRMVE